MSAQLPNENFSPQPITGGHAFSLPPPIISGVRSLEILRNSALTNEQFFLAGSLWKWSIYSESIADRFHSISSLDQTLGRSRVLTNGWIHVAN